MSWFARLFSRSDDAASAGPPDGVTERRKSGGNITGHARRRSDRHAHREKLYSVVREAMAMVGVLSLHYKFKVLALDPEGTQFIVMIDILEDVCPDIARLKEMESIISQKALSQQNLLVMAVYWRITDQTSLKRMSRPAAVATEAPGRPVAKASTAEAARPAPKPEKANFPDTDPSGLGGTQYGDLR